MEDLKQLIAAWVREARKSAELSQEELGTKLALDLGGDRGYTKANVSHWETQKHQPSIQQLLAIARVTEHPLPSSLRASLGQAVTEVSGSHGSAGGGEQGRATKPGPTTLQWVTDREAELLSEFRACAEPQKTSLLISARGLPKLKAITSARDKA
jgi:transcriptional regulator with XRE-family HTH domain